MSEIIKISDNLSVRPITMDDTPNIVRWRANPRVKNNFLFQGEITEAVHIQWMETKVASGQVIQFIILENDDGSFRPIGSVYFRDINQEEKSAEYGIFIGEDDAVGKSYGTQIAKWAIEYAHEEIGISDIILRVLADNISAIKSYEKAGFVPYDYKKEYLNGRDLVLMRAEY